ncbi:MAG: cation:proton antiporter [Ignavibacteriales bacterium]|nr:cation:proton antiporter [Ignavibacteriales bacterium]
MHGLLYDIGIAVIASTVIGFITHKLKQPIILGYLITGALVGPQIGFGLITEADSIEIISEIGLILLLFIIGLEMNPQKLISSGKQLIVTGIGQFVLCVLLGIGFFSLFNYSFSGEHLEGLYLALLCGLSSTAIVVKILYDKFESDTLHGRITLGVLIIQDVWAILLLAIQPNLANPYIPAIVLAIVKTVFLVVAGLLFSRYVLKYVFESIVNAPEMVVDCGSFNIHIPVQHSCNGENASAARFLPDAVFHFSRDEDGDADKRDSDHGIDHCVVYIRLPVCDSVSVDKIDRRRNKNRIHYKPEPCTDQRILPRDRGVGNRIRPCAGKSCCIVDLRNGVQFHCLIVCDQV